MASARIKHVINKRVLIAILSSPSGPVARDLLRRGEKVKSKAKRNLSRSPRRINTGTLRSSITVQLLMVNGVPIVRIGSPLFYAIFVHDGTGIYGPRGTPITPVSAKALVFPSKKFGAKSGKFAGLVVVKSVKGMKPNPFLKDALSAARD